VAGTRENDYRKFLSMLAKEVGVTQKEVKVLHQAYVQAVQISLQRGTIVNYPRLGKFVPRFVPPQNQHARKARGAGELFVHFQQFTQQRTRLYNESLCAKEGEDMKRILLEDDPNRQVSLCKKHDWVCVGDKDEHREFTCTKCGMTRRVTPKLDETADDGPKLLLG